ncbi:hypothetical protein BJ994_003454 [Arthrobacter pigmenti]|uniref:Uncharacterized protein n=1 Tax=Arthrobacter pigmenti TaxID=271432 RepID=A0A846RLV2_9MICC|nr:hypothetical protein [Arthrobacter pigmenti]NJC24378.1 hypothetical protein [Arthrobacter pigmenti]
MTSDSSIDKQPTEDESPLQSAPARAGRPVRWRRLLLGLGVVHALVVGFSLIAPLLTGEARGQTLFSVYFDVNYEGNFPTWWAVVQLTAATVTLLFAALLSRYQKVRGSAAWWILAAMVFLLCLDEGTWLHERLDGLAMQFVDVDDFTFVWLIFGVPVAVVTLVMAVLSARYLPEQSTRLIILGVATLVFAGVGLEFVAGELIRLEVPTVVLALVYHFEEFLELVAGALLLVAPLAALRVRSTGQSTSFALLVRS